MITDEVKNINPAIHGFYIFYNYDFYIYDK